MKIALCLTLRIQLLAITCFSSAMCCEPAKLSAKIVKGCPENETEWHIAAGKKNCSSIVQNCTSKTLEYHCVPNHFLNATMELCAPSTFIVNGWCPEFNEGGGTIQGNYNTNCKVFNKTACPSRYKSTEAYKYYECNDLVVRETGHLTQLPVTTSENVSPMSNITETTGNARSTSENIVVLSVCIVVGVLLVSVMCMVLIYKHRLKQNQDPFGSIQAHPEELKDFNDS